MHTTSHWQLALDEGTGALARLRPPGTAGYTGIIKNGVEGWGMWW